MMDLMVVDPNIAFATLLDQELARLGHHVAMCTSGAEALRLARREMPELVLLDMALDAPDALTLGRQLRELDAGVRLMLIPMIGDEIAIAADEISIQGVLPKPFFMPQLPDALQSALDAPLAAGWSATPDASQQGAARAGDPADEVEDELEELLSEGDAEETWDAGSLDWLAGLDDVDAAPAEPASTGPADGVESDALSPATSPEVASTEFVSPDSAQPNDTPSGDQDREADSSAEQDQGISRRVFRMNQGRVESLMRELAGEVGADGVLLTSENGLLTAVGSLNESELESISAAVLHGVETSEEVARILGREQLRFEQSITGGDYILYALSVHDAILAVTVSGDATLGLLRHTARATAERIAGLCVSG